MPMNTKQMFLISDAAVLALTTTRNLGHTNQINRTVEILADSTPYSHPDEISAVLCVLTETAPVRRAGLNTAPMHWTDIRAIRRRHAKAYPKFEIDPKTKKPCGPGWRPTAWLFRYGWN